MYDAPLALSLGKPLPSRVSDLLDVAVAIYIADRLALRQIHTDPRKPQDRWHRRIHLVIPLRYPDRWRRREVVALLRDLLAFLTDDSWSFEFTQRVHDPRRSEAPLLCSLPISPSSAVVLQSGGLDSLLGLIDLVANARVKSIVPVTVVTNSRVRRATAAITDEVRKVLTSAEPDLLPAQLRIGISGIGRPKDDREPTQRARGVLFLAAGVGAAVLAGSDRLHVCENGVGALSLAMTGDHWGARATKALHPRTLLLFSELSSLVLAQSLAIENLGLFDAKGELARLLADERFLTPARLTITCDQVSYLRLGEACGKCTSCILRRAALVAAGLDTQVDGKAVRYRTDWLDPSAEWSSGALVPLVAMRHQVERLRRAVEDELGFGGLDRAFPELLDVVSLAPSLGLTEDEVERRLVRLYRVYVDEFDALIAKIDRPGWARQASITELVTQDTVAAAG
jgi:hypothetical protein